MPRNVGSSMLDKLSLRSYRQFFQAIDRKPFSAAMLLSKIFKSSQTSSGHALSNKILEEITISQLDSLIDAIQNMSPSRKALLDPETVEQLHFLCEEIIHHDRWANRLSQTALLDLAQDDDWFRWALYRLLRLSNKANPPIIQDVLLDQCGQEHSSEEIARIYSSIETLPIKQLLRLASTPQRAKDILEDLSHHPNRFQLSKALIQKFPSLAPRIAQDWKQLLETMVRPPIEVASLQTIAKELAKTHPEFAGMSQVKRRSRHRASQPNSEEPSDIYRYLHAGWIAFSLPASTALANVIHVACRDVIPRSIAPLISISSYNAFALGVTYAGPIVFNQALQYYSARSRIPPSQQITERERQPNQAKQLYRNKL